MNYIDFITKTRKMSHAERGAFFAELDEDTQISLMDDYYSMATPEEMLLQVRIIGAAEMIEEEQKKEKRDDKKLDKWMQLYNKLVSELEAMK